MFFCACFFRLKNLLLVNGKMESISGEMFHSLPISHLLITFANSLDPDQGQSNLFNTLIGFPKTKI